MAFGAAFRQRYVLPVAASAFTTATVFSGRNAYAEDPSTLQDTHRHLRKPIYDDLTPSEPSPLQPAPSQSSSGSSILTSVFGSTKSEEKAPTASPTPTDRLAVHVRSARLTVYDWSVEAEKALNAFMTRTLNLERDFTSTVASLAPPPQANEFVVPGLIYVLVASLGGSIVTRNRGILLRASVPLGFGLVAAYAALPHTMRNVEDLIGKYEEGYPEVKRVHGQIQEQATYFWETGKAHTAMTVSRGEEALSEARKKVEDWVRQGK